MRRLTLVLAGVLALAALAPITAVSASTFVSVSDVTVEPTSPMPGELTTVEATIENPQSNSGPVDINAVAIRDRDSSNERVRAENVATLSPGSSTIATMQASFNSPGRHVLTVHVWGQDESGESIHVKHPKTITIGGQHPGIDVDTDDPVAGASNSGSVQVANGLESEVRNVKLSVDGGDAITVTNGQSVVAKLESGASTSNNFTFRPSEPGEHTLETRLTYVTSAGTERNVTEETTVVVDRFQNDVVLDADVVGGDSSPALEVDIHNRGNVDVERVSVTGSSPNATVRQSLIQRIPSGESETVRLNASLSEPTADVTLDATYHVGDSEHRTSTTTEVRSAPGTIELTGVQVTRDRGSLHITGSASNVGLADASSVIVGVPDTENVSPAAPNREYFVGTVPSSDFVTFDVYATTSGNATTIPVEVSYLADGERQERVFNYEAPATQRVDEDPEPQESSSGGGMLIPIAVGVVALLAVGGIVLYYYRDGASDDI